MQLVFPASAGVVEHGCAVADGLMPFRRTDLTTKLLEALSACLDQNPGLSWSSVKALQLLLFVKSGDWTR